MTRKAAGAAGAAKAVKATTPGAVPRAPAADEARLDDSRLRRLLGYNLSRADLRMRAYYQRYMAEFALRPAEFSALVLISANARLNQKRLGDALDVSAPNLAVLLDKLTERGLVVRVRSEEDRRAQHLHLTPRARAMLVRAEARATIMEEEVLTLLSVGERTLLTELLQKLERGPR